MAVDTGVIDKGLKKDALGFVSGVVIGVASTAPGYSLAASLGFVVAVAGVGLQAPAVMLIAFIPMLLIASAYYYMNRADPDCGTTFSWVTRAMGPSLGWIGGWAIVVADVIVMANLAQIAGLYSFLFASFSAVVSGVLNAVFIYWGWDSTVTVNEESRDAAEGPGKAALLSTVILLAIYVVVSIAAQAYDGPQFLIDNSDDVLSVLGTQVFGSPLDKILIIAVLTSAAASTQTTILPTAHTSLSMARAGAMRARLGEIHPRYLTPHVATSLMGALSIVWYVGLTIISQNILFDSIAALG